MYERTPNTSCVFCSKPIYRRPWELKRRKQVYCSHACKKTNGPKRTCPVCLIEFKPSHNANKTCSRSCSNVQRFGIKYNKDNKPKVPNHSQRRLSILREVFKFEECMIESCKYTKTFDIHRFLPGRNGGEYEIGNMFAICPNHHAEVERGLIRLGLLFKNYGRLTRQAHWNRLESGLHRKVWVSTTQPSSMK
jgi:hypothetical protein